MQAGRKLYIKTFGCQMNEYDSAKTAELLGESHDLILVIEDQCRRTHGLVLCRDRGNLDHGTAEIAVEQLLGIAKELSDVSVIEQRPNREGRTMLMVLAPEKQKGAKRKEDAKDQDT